MGRIRSKLMLYFILFSLIPVIVVSSIVYGVFSKLTTAEVSNSSMVSLEQISQRVDEKIFRVQYTMASIARDSNTLMHIDSADFITPNGDTFVAYKYIDSTAQSILNENDEIDSILIFSGNGGAYQHNVYLSDTTLATDSLWFKEITKSSSGVTMLRLSSENTKSLSKAPSIAFGMPINQFGSKNDKTNRSVIVFLMKPDFLIDIFSESENQQNNIIIVTDKNSEIISSNVSDYLSQSISYVGLPYPTQKKDSFQISLNGEDMVEQYFTSDRTGYSTIRLTPYSHYKKDLNKITTITVIVIVICLAFSIIMSGIVSKRISEPIKRLERGMVLLGNGDFDVYIPVESMDEIGTITDGFNHMAVDIKDLFDEALFSEQQKRKAQIAALQYQINPHFLYNTLSSIRMVALLNKSNDIAEMLKVLNRLLRNTLSKTGTVITVSEELANLRDYVTIQQVRYMNKFDIIYSVDDKTLDNMMPHMILQPIVENALTHGLTEKLNADSPNETLIYINVYQDKHLHLEIIDNGKGIDSENIIQLLEHNKHDDSLDSTVHIGLVNIHNQIQYLYGDGYGISIESELNQYTCVRITLPIVENNNENKEDVVC